MTTLGGIFHTLPFLISDVHTALVVAGCVVAVELVLIAYVRKRYLEVSMRSSLLERDRRRADRARDRDQRRIGLKRRRKSQW